MRQISIIEIIILLLIIVGVLYGLIRQSFVILGQFLVASYLTYLAAFLITLHFLNKRKIGFEKYFISICSMVSGIWLYEVFYHYSYAYVLNLNGILADLLNFTFNTMVSTGSARFPLIWSIIMITLPFVGYKYMKLNRYFVLGAIFAILLFIMWYYAGYPQFFAPQWYPQLYPKIMIIPIKYAHTTSSIIVLWGYIFNSLSKILCVVPSLLFIYKDDKRSGKVSK